MRYVPLVMVREHLDDIPQHRLPEGYRIRGFGSGDEAAWARIEVLAGEFPDEAAALERFEADFGAVWAELPGRCFLLENPEGEPIGTATAQDGQFAGERRGRVGWVGIVPAYQGRGLAKPLLSAVLLRLAEEYRRAYLTTQTTSYRAVNLYLQYGFTPWIETDEDREGWAIIEDVLNRAIL